MKKQKQVGRKRIILGTGREAAVKAQNLGASQRVCQRIHLGEQNFFSCCHSLPNFEVNGFKRTIHREISDKVHALASIYDNAFEIAAEAMINYSSRANIPVDEGFLKALVNKYAKILKFIDRRHQVNNGVRRSLDLNGDIARLDNTGSPMAGRGVLT